MQKRIWINIGTCLAMVILLSFCIFFVRERDFYLVALLLMVITLIPFLYMFERRVRLRDLLMMAVMTAAAVVLRIAFFMLPECKPTLAIVILAGASLGPEMGAGTGVLAAFISNFYFGQGMYTPYQMVAMGIVGLLAGLIFGLKRDTKKIAVSIFGFLSTAILYGAIVDLNTIFTITRYPSLNQVVSIYLAAIPFNLIHGGATAVFLWFLYVPINQRLRRVRKKYRIDMGCN